MVVGLELASCGRPAINPCALGDQTMTDASPHQVLSPTLIAITISNDQRDPVAKIAIKSQGQDIVITINDPRFLSNGKVQADTDIRAQFSDECSMLSVFPSRLEFWGDDGFISSIKGKTVELA